jgi:polysaccharide deacetylase family protein (PEP-CTERM system associated)
MPNVFSVDVEEWFHLLDNEQAPSAARWTSMESRVRHGTERLLNELADREITCTFFVLGWVADQHPELISDIAAAGHEIASHGYSHTLIYTQKPDEFRGDLRRAADAISRAAGVRPKGYRAPGFSIKRESLWALDVLVEEGFEYDSSVFPAARAHGGLPGTDPLPTVLDNGLVEFPISTLNLGFMRFSYLGGGYLRLLPRSLVLACAEAQVKAGIPLILYLHPRDVDFDQPRLRLAPHSYFRTYVGIGRCLTKVSALLDRFSWTSFEDYLRTSRPSSPSDGPSCSD